MDLRHLRYAVAIAEAGSFTRAAVRLRVAQPALSQQVAALEEELGVTLFTRGRRGAQVTAAGTELVERARALLRDATALGPAARRAARGETGRLRVGYLAALLGESLVRAVRELRGSRPGIEVELADRAEADQLRDLAMGSLDVAYLLFSPVRAQRQGLRVARAAASVRLGLLVPSAHALARRGKKRARLNELAGEVPASVAARASPEAFRFLHDLYAGAGLDVDRLREAETADGLVDLVAAGLAVAVVPEAVGLRQRAHTTYLRMAPTAAVHAHVAWREGETNPLVAALTIALGGIATG